MKLIRQPNKWSCLPTSFAMVMGISLDEVINRIGHDGSQIIYPDLHEPINHKCFHVQELIQVAWELGYAMVSFEYQSYLRHGDYVRDLDSRKSFIDIHLKYGSGVLISNSHAVAWNHEEQRIYDPKGGKRSLNGFDIVLFLRAYKM